MEKPEPSLKPEWMRSSGNGSSVGSSNRRDSSSHNSKNRNSRSRSDVDSVRTPFLDRSSSTNTRRGFSNGSTKHAYSSFHFNRSNRDKDRSREKDRLSYMGPLLDIDNTISFGTVLAGMDQELLRRSQSMITRKQGNHLAQGYPVGLQNGGGSINGYNGEGRLSGASPAKISRRTGFDKDFPSLRAEERNGVPNVVRITSPVHSLSVSNPLTVGEGWTSALAEVPHVIEKSVVGSHSNVGSLATTLTGPTSTSRNMAEALVQAPSRTGTPPEGSVNTQRLEDRAIKQSRQLIPVVPSVPKGSAHNSSDKSKTKPVVRSYGETGLAFSRNTQQQSSVQLSNHQSNHGSQIKPDTNKKLVILKPARENGVGAVKESGTPSQLTTAPSAQLTASVRSANTARVFKGASANMIAGKTAEKKILASRNAFYSALKQKTSTNISTDPSKTSSKELVASDTSSAQAATRDDIMKTVEKVSERIGFESAVRPDAKEAAFLKSLGWDENNSDEDEALTEEEIKAFIEQCKKFKPSLVQKLPIIQ